MTNWRVGVACLAVALVSACGGNGDITATQDSLPAPSSDKGAVPPGSPEGSEPAGTAPQLTGANLDSVAGVIAAAGGGCEVDETHTAADWLRELAEYGENPYFDPGTKGFAEDERRGEVLAGVLSTISGDTPITQHECSTLGSDVYADGTDGAANVLLVYVCCAPDPSLVNSLQNVGATVDPSPLPDDGSNYEPG